MWIGIRNDNRFFNILILTLGLAACGQDDARLSLDESRTRQDAVEAVAPGVDLIAVDPAFGGGSAMPGEKVAVSVAIANQGLVAADASQMRYFNRKTI